MSLSPTKDGTVTTDKLPPPPPPGGRQPETTTVMSNCPPKPTMGGFKICGSGTNPYALPWTGGIPNSTWTGLLRPKTNPSNPLQTRSTDPKATSSFLARQAGLYPGLEAEKFKRGDDLDYFCKLLRTAYKDMGMDTITYRQDPLDSLSMIDILESYPRLSKNAMKKQSPWFLSRYDEYDHDNDLQAKRFLLASLAIKPRKRVEQKASSDVLFAELLFIFIETERPLTVDSSQALVHVVLTMTPSSFPGEDISLFVEQIRPKIEQLEKGRRWDSMNNSQICRVLADAGKGSSGNPEYSTKLFNMLNDIEDECQIIAHLTNKEKATHMSSMNLGWDDILDLAEARYLTQITEGRVRWPPKCHAKDSKAPPISFGAANLSQLTPQANPSGGQAKQSNRDSKTSKYTPPDLNASPNRQVNGHPVYERMIHDRKFEWCATCNRWSTTHNSGTHTSKPKTPAPAPTQAPSPSPSQTPTPVQAQASLGFGLVPDPSLWLATHCLHIPDSTPTWSSRASKLLPFFGQIPVNTVLIGLSAYLIQQSLLHAKATQLCSVPLGETLHTMSFFVAPFFWLLLAAVSYHTIPLARPVVHNQFKVTQRRQGTPGKRKANKNKPRRHPRNQHFDRKAMYDLDLSNQIFRGDRTSPIKQANVEDAYFTVPLQEDSRSRLITALRSVAVSSSKDNSWVHAALSKLDNIGITDAVQFQLYFECINTRLHSKHHRRFHASTLLSLQSLLTDNSSHTSTDSTSAWLTESVILQHPAACKAAMHDDDTFTIIWDSGASMCVSFDKKDFTGPITTLPHGSTISGISSTLKIEGIGEVLWSVMGTTGKLRHLKLPCYYIPQLRQRLLSTSVFIKQYPQNPITISGSSWSIAPNPSDLSEGGIDVFINPSNNIPCSTCFRHSSVQHTATVYSALVSTTHASNGNLNEPQKELLRWHYRLGHVGFRTIQFIMRTGVLASSEGMRRLHTAAARLIPQDLPKCAACQFGRQTSRPLPGKISKVVKDRAGILSADQLKPGQRVFIDHFVCSTRGRRIKGYGIKDSKSPPRGSPTESYSGGCLFVDASSGLIHVEFQSHLNSMETINAVTKFEELSLDHGIVITGYASDNGSAFSSTAFKAHLQQHGQVSQFSGAGSHHQNGKVERSIRTIMAMARTMLLHAAVHWPDVADPSLWSLAVKHSVWIYNHIPSLASSGLSPLDIWSQSRFPLRNLHALHVWGSPVYVLQKQLADGKSIGRWEPRSQRCINMGFSANHAKSVPLVLNPSTGSITPQWNVTFDDYFSTVSTTDELPDFHADEWSQMFGTITSHFPSDDPDDPVSMPTVAPIPTRSEAIFDSTPPTPLPSSLISHPSSPSPSSVRPVSVHPSLSVETPFPSPLPSSPSFRGELPSPSQEELRLSPSQEEIPFVSIKTEHPKTGALKKISDYNNVSNKHSDLPTRPKRLSRPPLSYNPVLGNLAVQPVAVQPIKPTYASIVQSNTPNLNSTLVKAFAPPSTRYPSPSFLSSTQSPSTPISVFEQAFYASAKKKNPDILSYNEAMNDFDNLQKWLDAAGKEISQLESKFCWEDCTKDDAAAAGENVVPCTWVFRYKRNPAGDIIKCKARICLRGDLMVDDQESYAPVCSWSSVRFFLVLAMIMGWKTVSVDWANAFIQATLKKPMYMATPRGFRSKLGNNGCLRLLKSLYGSKFAPRNWYTHLRKALLQLGLKESAIDPCLLYRENLIMVLYVDDAGICAPTRDIINAFVQELKDLDFDLDIEDDFNSYLGIGIEEFEDGSRHMTQKGLIKKIIATCDMEGCNPNWNPTSQVSLGSDPDGEAYNQIPFHYASVVGMLLYLSNNTRLDITFAVSQVSRFTAAPKKSHASAVKTIARYLARTAENGIVVKPDGSYNLRTWVDADFSGLHGQEPQANPASAKSRYGYIITFAGVPLLWKSQLISEICLSTLHAEYVGLSSALRAMIPLRTLTVDLLSFLDLPDNRPEVHCTIFEDNQGAFLLATNQRVSSRTKYFNVKHHFFWSYVYSEEKNPNGWITIHKCPTDLMNADYLTKGLVRTVFESNRLRVQGW